MNRRAFLAAATALPLAAATAPPEELAAATPAATPDAWQRLRSMEIFEVLAEIRPGPAREVVIAAFSPPQELVLTIENSATVRVLRDVFQGRIRLDSGGAPFTVHHWGVSWPRRGFEVALPVESHQRL